MTSTSRNRASTDETGSANIEPAAIDEAHPVREALDFLDVVRGDEYRARPIVRRFEQGAHELVADERIEAGERLVQDDQLGPIGERREERRLHARAA